MMPLTDDECDCPQHRPRDLVRRLLPPDEWEKVRATGMQLPRAQAAAGIGDVIVVERGAQIVGTCALFTLYHAEGLWIDDTDPDRVAVLGALWSALTETAQRRGVTAAWINPTSERLALIALKRGAQPLAGHHLILPLEA